MEKWSVSSTCVFDISLVDHFYLRVQALHSLKFLYTRFKHDFHVGQNIAASLSFNRWTRCDSVIHQTDSPSHAPSLSLFSVMHVQGRPVGRTVVSYQVMQPELILELFSS